MKQNKLTKQEIIEKMGELAGTSNNKSTLNENVSSKNSTLMYYKKAQDGRAYGIVKENAHYFIKVANGNKPNLNVTDFAYIGGLPNKLHEKCDSYNIARTRLDGKIKVITESFEYKQLINKDALDELDIPLNKDIDKEKGEESTPAPESTPSEEPVASAEPAVETPSEEPSAESTPAPESTPSEEPIASAEPTTETPSEESTPSADSSEEDGGDTVKQIQSLIGKLTQKMGEIGSQMDDKMAKNAINSVITASKEGITKMDDKEKEDIKSRIDNNGEKLDEMVSEFLSENVKKGLDRIIKEEVSKFKKQSLIENIVRQEVAKTKRQSLIENIVREEVAKTKRQSLIENIVREELDNIKDDNEGEVYMKQLSEKATKLAEAYCAKKGVMSEGEENKLMFENVKSKIKNKLNEDALGKAVADAMKKGQLTEAPIAFQDVKDDAEFEKLSAKTIEDAKKEAKTGVFNKFGKIFKGISNVVGTGVAAKMIGTALVPVIMALTSTGASAGDLDKKMDDAGFSKEAKTEIMSKIINQVEPTDGEGDDKNPIGGESGTKVFNVTSENVDEFVKMIDSFTSGEPLGNEDVKDMKEIKPGLWEKMVDTGKDSMDIEGRRGGDLDPSSQTAQKVASANGDFNKLDKDANGKGYDSQVMETEYQKIHKGAQEIKKMVESGQIKNVEQFNAEVDKLVDKLDAEFNTLDSENEVYTVTLEDGTKEIRYDQKINQDNTNNKETGEKYVKNSTAKDLKGAVLKFHDGGAKPVKYVKIVMNNYKVVSGESNPKENQANTDKMDAALKKLSKFGVDHVEQGGNNKFLKGGFESGGKAVGKGVDGVILPLDYAKAMVDSGLAHYYGAEVQKTLK